MKWFPCAALFVALLTGCSSRSAKVSGKVTYKDKTVTSGTVTFVGEKRVESGAIASDGTYEIANLPVGTVKIAVITVQPPGAVQPQQQGKDDKITSPAKGTPKIDWVNVPAKYKNAETSELSYTVTPGEQNHDIVLK